MGFLLCGCQKQDTLLSLPKFMLPETEQQFLRRFEVPRVASCRTLEFSGSISIANQTNSSKKAAIFLLRFFDAEGKPCEVKGLIPTKMFKEPASYRYLSGRGGGTERFSGIVPIPDEATTVEVGLSRFFNDFQIELQDFQLKLSWNVLTSLAHEVKTYCVRNVLWLFPLCGVALVVFAVLIWKYIRIRVFLRFVIKLALILMAVYAFINTNDPIWKTLLCLAVIYTSGVTKKISKMVWVEKMNEFFCRPIPERPFDLVATNVCKGVAICLMLFHHCFALYHGRLNPLEISLQRGGKLCVAIFCVLSGFGLMRVKLRGAGLKMDIFHLAKLLINFWFVAAIWILFSCLLEGRGFAQVYPKGWNPQFFYDISGIGAPGHCFCPAWWYMGAIVPLYFAFPFLSWLCRKAWPWLLVIALFTICIADRPRNYFGAWTWAFVLGMVAAQEGFMEKVSRSLCYLSAVGVLVATLWVFYFRSVPFFVSLCEGIVGAIFVFGIYVGDVAFIHRVKPLQSVLLFLGRHSMNIFLIHLYFNMYYKEFLLQFSPMVGFSMVLAASLACSMVVEWLKYLSGLKWAMAKFKKLMT